MQLKGEASASSTPAIGFFSLKTTVVGIGRLDVEVGIVGLADRHHALSAD